MFAYLKKELKKFQKVLRTNNPECFESQGKSEEVVDGEEKEQRRSRREAFLKITLDFLRTMKQEELADSLRNSKTFKINVKIIDSHVYSLLSILKSALNLFILVNTPSKAVCLACRADCCVDFSMALRQLSPLVAKGP